MAEADLSILKIQKACVCISGGIDLQRCRFRRAEIERQSTGHLHFTSSDSPFQEIKEIRPTWVGSLLFGGAEGNRTPVRKQLDKTFSGCSLLFTFPLPHGNKHPYGIGSFMMRGMGKAYHTHGLHSNDTQARLVDLPGRMRA